MLGTPLLHLLYLIGPQVNRGGLPNALANGAMYFITRHFYMEIPLGLTVTPYAKLLAHPRRALTELSEAPVDIQKKVRQSLQHQPLSRQHAAYCAPWDLPELPGCAVDAPTRPGLWISRV
ncbi:MAG: hypothetical protein HOI25_13055 [Proteobacteria bacterium]|jgi:hypothetical protein|nr:hypothetical protein [Pseudomonadota bacterium]